MINWIRRKLGLCVHDWRDWRDIYDMSGSACGKWRECRKCPLVQREEYPDGH